MATQAAPYKVTRVPPIHAVWPLPASAIIPYTESGFEGVGEGFHWGEDVLAAAALVGAEEPPVTPLSVTQEVLWGGVMVVTFGIFFLVVTGRGLGP